MLFGKIPAPIPTKGNPSAPTSGMCPSHSETIPAGAVKDPGPAQPGPDSQTARGWRKSPHRDHTDHTTVIHRSRPRPVLGEGALQQQAQKIFKHNTIERKMDLAQQKFMIFWGSFIRQKKAAAPRSRGLGRVSHRRTARHSICGAHSLPLCTVLPRVGQETNPLPSPAATPSLSTPPTPHHAPLMLLRPFLPRKRQTLC